MHVAPPAAPVEPVPPRALHVRPAIAPAHAQRGPGSPSRQAVVVSLPVGRALGRRRLHNVGPNWIWICPVIVLIVGAFDLACTLGALHYGVLHELNPIAARVIAAGGAIGLACYRAVITLLGCGLLVWGLRMYRDRRFNDASHGRIRRVVWLGQGVLLVSHLGLVTWWTLWFLV